MTILIHKKEHGHCINGKFEHAQIVFRQPRWGIAFATRLIGPISYWIFFRLLSAFWRSTSSPTTHSLPRQSTHRAFIGSLLNAFGKRCCTQLGIQ
jgi:hypothetical protein